MPQRLRIVSSSDLRIWALFAFKVFMIELVSRVNIVEPINIFGFQIFAFGLLAPQCLGDESLRVSFRIWKATGFIVHQELMKSCY